MLPSGRAQVLQATGTGNQVPMRGLSSDLSVGGAALKALLTHHRKHLFSSLLFLLAQISGWTQALPDMVVSHLFGKVSSVASHPVLHAMRPRAAWALGTETSQTQTPETAADVRLAHSARDCFPIRSRLLSF